jgi:hypothetical protein
MPFDYTVDTKNHIITIMGEGHESMKERNDCINRMMHDQSIDGRHHVFIKVCEVLNNPSIEEMHSIVTLIEKLHSKFGGRVAILNTAIGHVTITELIALSACCGANNVRAFLSEKEVREWLCTGASSHAQPRHYGRFANTSGSQRQNRCGERD